MKRKWKYLLLGTIVLMVSLILNTSATAGSFSYEIYTDVSKYTHSMPYRLFVPDHYIPQLSYPLVLCLHGLGERGTDNEAQLTANALATIWADGSNQEKHPCFVLAPQCPKVQTDPNDFPDELWVDVIINNIDSNPELVSKSLAGITASDEELMVLDILAQTRTEYNIDSDRIYCTGLSLGAMGTWAINLHNPDLFAAMVAMCGIGDPAQASLIANKAIRVFHSADDPIVPVERSREMVDAINGVQEGGGYVYYTEYNAYGHDCWDPALETPDYVTWLMAQRKGVPATAAPRIIDISHYDPWFSWCYLTFGKNDNDQVKRYQTFIAGIQPKITKIDIKIKKAGNSGQTDVTVKLYATSNHKPTGSALASATIPASSVGTSITLVIAYLNYSGLVNGTEYAIVLGQVTPSSSYYMTDNGVNVSDNYYFGKWNGTTYTDESWLADAWMRIYTSN